MFVSPLHLLYFKNFKENMVKGMTKVQFLSFFFFVLTEKMIQ